MKIFFLIFFFAHVSNCLGQADSNQRKTDTNNIHQLVGDSIVPGHDSVAVNPAIGDTVTIDSNKVTVSVPRRGYETIVNEELKKNKFINLAQRPISAKNIKGHHHSKEYLFYLLAGIFLIFGFFKVFYSTYFHNIFRVFFNTSLRQNQLTDLLLQAKLPSLIFNIFFTVTAGLYLWLLLHYYNFTNDENNKKALAICILAITLIYTVKFCVLKFIGWATGMVEPVDTYIFVIFLVNKITGIALIPFVILLAFGSSIWQTSIVIASYLIITVLFLLRFVRSYSLLQHRLKISRLHFMLYIVSIELLPLLVAYKLFLKFFFKV
jgi:hypothetical protein